MDISEDTTVGKDVNFYKYGDTMTTLNIMFLE